MASKKRILFGAVDIGYRIEHYSQFINENFSDRLEAESFSKYVLPSSHFRTSYTYTCEIYKKTKIYVYLYTLCFFIYALFRYDIFHFLSGELILTRKLRRFELWTYRKLGKKIIMHFVGADIRSLKYLDWKRESIEDYLHGKENPLPISEDFQKSLVKDSLTYAQHILVSSADLLEIIPEATFFPVLLNDSDLAHASMRKEGPVKILFSPSSHRTKGSKYVHGVLEKIKDKYADNVELLVPGYEVKSENAYAMTRYELLNAMRSADIVIDQMIIGWYGLKSVEALFLGCHVICFIDSKYEHNQFEDCPIYNANVLNLYSQIEFLVNHTMEGNRNVDNKEWLSKYHFIESYKPLLNEIWLN
jgi:hypothetical protein